MWIALNITVHHVAGMLILWGTLLFYSLQLEHYRSEELATRSWSCFSLVGQTFVNVWPVRLVLFVRVALQQHLYSLVSRPSTPPVFDHLQYAKTYASSFWGVEGLGTRLLLHLADQSSTHGHFLSGDFFYGAVSQLKLMLAPGNSGHSNAQAAAYFQPAILSDHENAGWSCGIFVRILSIVWSLYLSLKPLRNLKIVYSRMCILEIFGACWMAVSINYISCTFTVPIWLICGQLLGILSKNVKLNELYATAPV